MFTKSVCDMETAKIRTSLLWIRPQLHRCVNFGLLHKGKIVRIDQYLIGNMPASQLLDLSHHSPPEPIDIGNSEMSPFALYNLASLSITELEGLTNLLDRDDIIGTETCAVRLVRCAPELQLQQRTLHDTLDTHFQHCLANKSS